MLISVVGAVETRNEYYTTTPTGFTATSGTNYRGQSFTIGTVGNNEAVALSNVSLLMGRFNATTGTLTVRLYAVDGSGLPTGSILSTGTLNTASIAESNNQATFLWYNISMSSYNLQPSTKYAITWNTSAGQTNFGLVNPGTYAGGTGMTGTWDNQVYDINFQIFGSLGEVGIIATTLNSPANNSVIGSTNYTFNASYIIINANLVNATYWIWNSTGIFNKTTLSVLGNTTNSTVLQIYSLSLGDYNWNVEACGTNLTSGSLCSFANSNFSFSWRPFTIVNQNYSYNVYETDRQRFNLTINTLTSILSVNSKLNYNGTLYNANTVCSSGQCDIYSIIDIPLVPSGESQNKSFNWQISVYDGTSSYSFNTTETGKQNVSRIHLEECNAVYTTKTLNFTAYSETNLSKINPFQIAGTFDTWLGGGSVYRSQNFNKGSTANLTLCLTPTAKTQYTNAQIDYSLADDNITYIPRNYFFSNASLTSTLQTIPLYLLEAEDSTTFIIKVQDQKLSPVAGALIYIQRYYPSDGMFRTVQIAKTDSNGETIGFYEVETVDYKHIIVKDGEVLLDTTQQKVVGKDFPYTLTFTTGEALGLPWVSFEKNSSIFSSLSFNETSKMVTFTYIDSTGSVTSARLLVVQPRNNNSTTVTICDTTSTQSSTTLTCNMSGYEGGFIAYGYIETDVSDLINFIISTAKDIFGREGLLMAFFIILVASFSFIWNPTAGIIATNCAVIFVNIIGLASFSPIFIFAMIGISILGVILLRT